MNRTCWIRPFEIEELMHMEEIQVFVEDYDIEEVETVLRQGLDEGITVERRTPEVSFDGLSLDLSPLIVAGASVLSSTITAAFVYVAARKSGTIVIAGKSGRRIVIPSDTPKDQIPDFINAAKEIDVDKVTIRNQA